LERVNRELISIEQRKNEKLKEVETINSEIALKTQEKRNLSEQLTSVLLQKEEERSQQLQKIMKEAGNA